MVSVPIAKLARLRWLCAPQWASTGQATSPSESVSMRTSPIAPKISPSLRVVLAMSLIEALLVSVETASRFADGLIIRPI